jgi:hypothetical protein
MVPATLNLLPSFPLIRRFNYKRVTLSETLVL